MKTANETMKETAQGMSRELTQNSQDINGFLTVAEIQPLTQTHWTNTATGENGIADLITHILRENDSVFPLNVGNTELRQIAIAGSMFTEEILAKVQAYFTAGSTRYPLQTIKNYLATYMFKKGKVGKIQLTGKEDATRECARPRCKWFLVQ